MTAQDKEIQELRRENEKLKKNLESYKEIHMLDIAQISYLRRQIDFLMEGTVVANSVTAN